MRYRYIFVLLFLAFLIINASGKQTSKEWTNEGANLANQGKYNESLNAYDKAIWLNSRNVAAWSGKGWALYNLGKYNESLGAYDNATQLNPNNAVAWNGKGLALYSLGEYTESIEAFNQAIKLNPFNSDYQKARDLALSALNGSNGSSSIVNEESSIVNAENTTNVDQLDQSNIAVSTVGNRINLALYKSADQSSLLEGSPSYNASKGVDGSLKTFFHTEKDSTPWWQVDLGRIYPLSEVIIYNRQDCCQERIRNLTVLLSNDSVNWVTAYDNVKDNDGKIFGSDGEPLQINFKGKKARFVRLQLQEEKWLNVAEVEIYESAAMPTPIASNNSANLAY